MKILFLDDSKERCKTFLSSHPTAEIFHSADTAIERLHRSWTKGEAWDLICLDHDLDDSFDKPWHENTGMAVAEWLYGAAVGMEVKKVIVHSLNAPAAERMVHRLREGGYRVEHIPFFWQQK